jgi:hypothetical protein
MVMTRYIATRGRSRHQFSADSDSEYLAILVASGWKITAIPRTDNHECIVKPIAPQPAGEKRKLL